MNHWDLMPGAEVILERSHDRRRIEARFRFRDTTQARFDAPELSPPYLWLDTAPDGALHEIASVVVGKWAKAHNERRLRALWRIVGAGGRP